MKFAQSVKLFIFFLLLFFPSSYAEENTQECASCDNFLGKICDGLKDGQRNSSLLLVLHNLDLVEYFEDFKLPDGTYDESLYGTTTAKTHIGIVYKGHSFMFNSWRNRELFATNPEKYIPQWGGFCSYGISSEFCPEYPWSRDCMGPSISVNHWTIYKGKLYFFLYSEAKKAFMADIDKKIAIGNRRWAEMYPNPDDAPLNGICITSKPTV